MILLENYTEESKKHKQNKINIRESAMKVKK